MVRAEGRKSGAINTDAALCRAGWDILRAAFSHLWNYIHYWGRSHHGSGGWDGSGGEC